MRNRFLLSCSVGCRLVLGLLCLLLAGSAAAFAADLTLPQHAVANTSLTINTTGQGHGRFYLLGPAARIKQSVQLGEAIHIKAESVRQAGQYTAILRGDGDTVTRTFYVSAGQPTGINFLAQPSRVPTGVREVISGTAFVMDADNNLVDSPTPVKFELALEGTAPVTRTVSSRDGIAWTRMDSGRRAGSAQFTASVGTVEVRRVVQQVASEPCNLRFRAQPSKQGILVETDPVRDCAGNPVPDGTIVTFTDQDPSGRSTVDARIKKGVATAILPAAPQATITVASGVVIGNEVRWGGGR